MKYKVGDIIKESPIDCGCRFEILEIGIENYAVKHVLEEESFLWSIKNCDERTELSFFNKEL